MHTLDDHVLRMMLVASTEEEDVTKMGASLRSAMEGLIKTNSSLVPEVEGDMTIAVGEEMSATVQAVEDAVARIQELLQKSRETDKGHKLEVNSSILGACTTLMEVCTSMCCVFSSSHGLLFTVVCVDTVNIPVTCVNRHSYFDTRQVFV